MAQQGAQGQAAAAAAAAAAHAPGPAQGGPQQPLYIQWRKTISDYTKHLPPCDGSNKAEVRNMLDCFEALRQWTAIPDQVCMTVVGFITKDILRDSVLAFLLQNPQAVWAQVRAHIENIFLEDDEPDFQRRELEKIRQGTFEDSREYSQHYLKALGRAYTQAQLQDPIHLERVIRCYVRGLHSGDVREKVYDSQPQTLQEAMNRAHAYSKSRKLRAERNGPNLDTDPFKTDVLRRKEEPMDIGYLNQAINPGISDQQKADPADERLEGMEKKLKGMQKQIGGLTKGMAEIKAHVKSLVETDSNRPTPPRQQPPAGNRPQGAPQRRPDQRQWDKKGVPFCLRCGDLVT